MIPGKQGEIPDRAQNAQPKHPVCLSMNLSGNPLGAPAPFRVHLRAGVRDLEDEG
jgi:hypothetical protein